MPTDYTDAPPPPKIDLIPAGTIATVSLLIKPGGVGEDEMLTRSNDGGCEMLVCECTVVDGPYAKRKVWPNLILEGTTDGHAEIAARNRRTLKAILDSALGLKPNDTSPEARAARTVSLKQFNGVAFMAKIGIEKGKPKNDGSGENWPDKNTLAAIITPDKKEWHPVEQPPPFDDGGAPPSGTAPAGSAPPTTVARPGWAT
jgi:hypothetical protein